MPTFSARLLESHFPGPNIGIVFGLFLFIYQDKNQIHKIPYPILSFPTIADFPLRNGDTFQSSFLADVLLCLANNLSHSLSTVAPAVN
jgi:hypothetical protein